MRYHVEVEAEESEDSHGTKKLEKKLGLLESTGNKS
jgi:hypothetical protein